MGRSSLRNSFIPCFTSIHKDREFLLNAIRSYIRVFYARNNCIGGIIMPMFWDAKQTEYGKRHSEEEAKVFSHINFVLTNWLYSEQVGSYAGRGDLEQMGKIAIFSEKDVEAFLTACKEDQLFIGWEDEHEEVLRIKSLLPKLVGMKVWASWFK